MRLILLGPPGAGKGTQAARVAARFGVPHVATGDMLRGARDSGTELGNEARAYMDRGELVPDELMLGLLRERLSREDAAEGFLLDGFPRNLSQAEALDGILSQVAQDIDAVISIEVPDEEIVERISGRRSCPVCGRVYHLTSNPPAVDELCDADGTKLEQRADDKADVVLERLRVFHSQTKPLIAFYADRGLLKVVDGVGPVDEVESRIAAALEGAGVS